MNSTFESKDKQNENEGVMIQKKWLSFVLIVVALQLTDGRSSLPASWPYLRFLRDGIFLRVGEGQLRMTQKLQMIED